MVIFGNKSLNCKPVRHSNSRVFHEYYALALVFRQIDKRKCMSVQKLMETCQFGMATNPPYIQAILLHKLGQSFCCQRDLLLWFYALTAVCG